MACFSKQWMQVLTPALIAKANALCSAEGFSVHDMELLHEYFAECACQPGMGAVLCARIT